MKLGLLCSGGLGLKVLDYLFGSNKPVFVFTDRGSIDIIKYCEIKKISLFVGNPRDGKSGDFINNKEIDLLISINYLFIIESTLINLPKILAFNIHGSLLPKYRGRTPHVWAIINNETKTGITAHCIDDGFDTGDIIDQVEISIECNDTGADILKKFGDLYIPIVDAVLKKVELKSLRPEKQDETKATYFGKRTPDDGQIDWSWQKERIRNWIRAQSNPYPGAFTYYDSKKIIIDEIRYSDCGYNSSQKNGTILSVRPLIIKTPNGAIEITKLRTENISFIKNNNLI